MEARGHGDTVKVYNFCVFDIDAKHMRIAPCKAPRDVIVRRFHGEVLEGTAQCVAVDELDEDGRYRRIATGWGELG